MIMANAISLGVTWYGEPKSVTYSILALNYFFSSVFIIEAILKLVGLGVKPFFKDSWNVFDFTVVMVTIIAEIVS
jgi:voltage-dependent calcium channel T type alpha-1I